MLLTSGCEYAIRAVLYVASQSGDAPVHVRAISDDLEIPFSFLAKVVGVLARRGILNSQKGRGGGVNLGRPAEEISLMEVVEAIDGPGSAERCVMGLPDCTDEKPCPLHGNWAGIREDVRAMFGESTVATMAAKLQSDESTTGTAQ